MCPSDETGLSQRPPPALVLPSCPQPLVLCLFDPVLQLSKQERSPGVVPAALVVSLLFTCCFHFPNPHCHIPPMSNNPAFDFNIIRDWEGCVGVTMSGSQVHGTGGARTYLCLWCLASCEYHLSLKLRGVRLTPPKGPPRSSLQALFHGPVSFLLSVMSWNSWAPRNKS